MSNKNPVNIAASVLARLKNLAVQRGWNFMHMLTRYGIERFLFRLGASEYARQFVLKGGIRRLPAERINVSLPFIPRRFPLFWAHIETAFETPFPPETGRGFHT